MKQPTKTKLTLKLSSEVPNPRLELQKDVILKYLSDQKHPQNLEKMRQERKRKTDLGQELQL